jgi:hypothetical protein
MSTTPAINPCHGFSVIAGVVDTGDIFIAGDNDTGEQGVWVSMDASVLGGSNETIGGRVRLRRPETQSPIVSLEPP